MQANVRRVARFVGALACIASVALTAAPSFAQDSAKNSGLPPGAESDAQEGQEPGLVAPAPAAETPAASTPAAPAGPQLPGRMQRRLFRPPGLALRRRRQPMTAAAAPPAPVPADPIVAVVRTKLGEIRLRHKILQGRYGCRSRVLPPSMGPRCGSIRTVSPQGQGCNRRGEKG